jgi:hypothetical protein
MPTCKVHSSKRRRQPPGRSIRPSVRFRVLSRFGFACGYCGACFTGSPETKLVVDHILPVAAGGSDEGSNLIACCLLCNQGKGCTFVAGCRYSFVEYLRHQRGREDWIGDLADDEAKKPLLKEPSSYRELAAALRALGGNRNEVLRAAWHAWREWRRLGRPTRATRAMHKQLRESIRRTTAGSCLWLKKGFWAEGKFFSYRDAV